MAQILVRVLRSLSQVEQIVYSTGDRSDVLFELFDFRYPVCFLEHDRLSRCAELVLGGMIALPAGTKSRYRKGPPLEVTLDRLTVLWTGQIRKQLAESVSRTTRSGDYHVLLRFPLARLVSLRDVCNPTVFLKACRNFTVPFLLIRGNAPCKLILIRMPMRAASSADALCFHRGFSPGLWPYFSALLSVPLFGPALHRSSISSHQFPLVNILTQDRSGVYCISPIPAREYSCAGIFGGRR
jgi:hypothetical protein